MTKEDAIKRIMWFRDDSGVLNIKDLQALDMAIEALQNTRPAPDQDGAEEVLKNLFGSGSFQFSYSIDQCLQAMTTHARNEVAKAVAEKDAEIERYFNETQKMATRHGNLYGKALAELTAAKKRIEELEDAVRWALGETDFRLHNNGEVPYWWRNELRQRANIKPQ